MKKILVALDNNSAAPKVAVAGYAIAAALHAEVTLVHVISQPAYYAMEYAPVTGCQSGSFEKTIALTKEIKVEAENFLTITAEHLSSKNIKIKVLEGDTEDAILKYAAECKTDLIVMGSHNHKGLERLFVTDMAAHVLKHSKIPLFIIPTADK
jgi:nucleotide-binding universal stress UspA family protein